MPSIVQRALQRDKVADASGDFRHPALVTAGIWGEERDRRSMPISFPDKANVMLLDILTHTPIWVFVLFAIIVAMGARRLGDGERDVRRVCAVPILFIVFGLLRLFQHDDAMAASAWLVAAAAGSMIGCMASPAMAVTESRHRIFMAGSAWPLARIVVIFVAHYFLNVAAIMSFDHRVDFMRLDAAVSGITAGFFAGWLLRFVQSYRSARANPARAGNAAVVQR